MTTGMTTGRRRRVSVRRWVSSLRSGLSPPSRAGAPEGAGRRQHHRGLGGVCSRDVFQCGVCIRVVGSCQRRHPRRVVVEWDGMEQGEENGGKCNAKAGFDVGITTGLCGVFLRNQRRAVGFAGAECFPRGPV